MRYDSELSAGAKILYAEISSLTRSRGFCFADNEYFMQLYGVTERTLQRYLDALKKGGYIRIQDGDGGSGRRKIFAGINPFSENPDKNDGVAENPDKNDGGTPTILSPNPDKNVAANRNNKSINKKDDQKPPVSPANEIAAWIEAYAGDDLQLRDALLHFAANRQAIKKPIKTQHAMTLLLTKLDRLSRGDRALKIELVQEAEEKNWLSFYLHDDRRQPDARAVEAPPGVAAW